jgi:SHAQKYF class myb-like DNA-binding protein
MTDIPNDAEGSEEPQQYAPQPPPFNPMSTHNNQPQTLGNSVVPALMNVYESMTQSSTPQDPNDPTTGDEHAYDPSQQGGQQVAYDPYFNTQSIPPGPPQHGGYYSPTSQPQHAQYYGPPPAPPGSFQGPSPPVIPPVPDYPATTAVEQPSTPQQVASFPPPGSDGAKFHSAPDPAPLSATGGRSLRKRSLEKGNCNDRISSKTRKKGNNTDGRWSKRFTWPDDLHRDFVSAIFDVGLKHSSPSAILEHMPTQEQITSERIKSHLQKYRLHRTKSKKEFMTSYDASISKLRGNDIHASKDVAQGRVAALLSFSTMTDKDTSTSSVATKDEGEKQELVPKAKPAPRPKDNASKLVLPQLSEEEKKAPIGTSLGYLMGLFFSLRQQLMAQRAAQLTAAGAKPIQHGIVAVPDGNPQVGAIYSHFATGAPQQYPQDALAPPWCAPAHMDGTAPPPSQAYHQDALIEQKLDGKAPPSTRTNFEQNKLMKLEMQNQMAFQNKMRDLKQRELNKYKPVPEQNVAYNHKGGPKTTVDDLTPNPVSLKKDLDEGKDIIIDPMDHRSQGAGENAEAGDSALKGRLRGLSVGVSDEFWNTDVVDEQLFEFLMDP